MEGGGGGGTRRSDQEEGGGGGRWRRREEEEEPDLACSMRSARAFCSSSRRTGAPLAILACRSDSLMSCEPAVD